MKRLLLLSIASAAVLFAAQARALISSCELDDVTFRGADAVACGFSQGGNNDTAAKLGALSVSEGVGSFGPNTGESTWFLLARDNVPTGNDISNNVFGVRWTLSAATATVTGNWVLTWTPGTGTPGLPLTIDMAVVLKAGTDFVAYLFSPEHFLVTPNSGAGTYEVVITNRKFRPQDLSHITVYGRNPRSCTEPGLCVPDQPLPEPGTLGMLAVGLTGLLFLMRRRRRY